MDDLHVAWMLLGWMLAFWSGKDLQARFVRKLEARRQIVQAQAHHPAGVSRVKRERSVTGC